jgi:hypothetical protein
VPRDSVWRRDVCGSAQVGWLDTRPAAAGCRAGGCCRPVRRSLPQGARSAGCSGLRSAGQKRHEQRTPCTRNVTVDRRLRRAHRCRLSRARLPLVATKVARQVRDSVEKLELIGLRFSPLQQSQHAMVALQGLWKKDSAKPCVRRVDVSWHLARCRACPRGAHDRHASLQARGDPSACHRSLDRETALGPLLAHHQSERCSKAPQVFDLTNVLVGGAGFEPATPAV